ncbi:MAG: response regulator [Methylobacterium sp.]|nr:response regulator [Methylobacterium sp.]
MLRLQHVHLPLVANVDVRLVLNGRPGQCPRGASEPLMIDGPTVVRIMDVMVDDEPTACKLVTEVLEDLGYHQVEAPDGPTGLEVLRADARLDLLVTDVGWPWAMNGPPFTDAGRSVRPGVKVLFITGYASKALIGSGRREPGKHVVTKPFAIEVLADRIVALVRRTEPEPGESFGAATQLLRLIHGQRGARSDSALGLPERGQRSFRVPVGNTSDPAAAQEAS